MSMMLRMMLATSCVRFLPAVLTLAALTAGSTAMAWQAPPLGSRQVRSGSPPEKPIDPKTQQLNAIVASSIAMTEKGQFDNALAEADKALAIDANWMAAHVAKGMAFNGKGDFDAAVKEFDLVTAITGREPEKLQSRADAYAHRSHAMYEKGEYLTAIDNAYFALLEKSDHVLAHTNRAKAYIAREQFDKAIQSADRAINVDKDSAEAYSLRGYAYALKGNADQGIADQKKALELNAGLAEAYQRRVSAHLLKKDAASAAQDVEKAISMKPNSPDAYCDRAYLKALQGDANGALVDLNKAISVNPKFAKAHLQKGLALLDQKNFDGALQCFDEVLRLQPSNASGHCYRGYAMTGREDYATAVKDFTRAIELNPKLVVAYSGRNIAYKKQGLTREASTDMAKVRELAPETDKKKKKDDKDKKEEETPKFVVKSKPVDPNKRREMLKSAAEIDRLVTANYARTGTKPNEKTSDAQFLRRIYLDITGTIPTYTQTRKFLTSSDPLKRSLLIDELLSSDGYASHHYNYWADVLRYTDSLNTNVRGEPYRQWIKQSLAESKPWDKMVHEMLTAEGLIWKNPASGYLQRDSGMPLDNMNNNVRIFLGTRIGCAQCHDHPFDKWTQKEFYQMAAFTYGTLTSTHGNDKRYWNSNPDDRLQAEYAEIEQEEEDRRNNSYRFDRIISINMMMVNDQIDRKISLPADYQYDNAKPGDVIAPKALFGKDADIRAGEAPRMAFARWVTSKENPRFALTIANRLWKQAFGIGQIEPVDDMMDSTVAENPELMTFLESEMKRLNFDMKEFQRMLFHTEVYQRQCSVDEVNPGDTYHFPGPVLRRMTAEQAWDSFLTLAVPDEFRELPADVRTTALGMDLTTVKAPDVLAADNMANTVDGERSKREARYTYKGVLLARASELPSPVPASHFLRMFGQSDRELISASSTTGSVPQVLLMFNGPVSHMLLESNSTIYNNVMKKRTLSEGVRSIFLTILNREPDDDELKLSESEVARLGAAGYGNVIWSLVNTREFLFIQ